MSIGTTAGSNFLLFLLVFGMSATVDIRNMKKQIQNWKALATGVLLQFIVMPFLGFIAVKSLSMTSAASISLMVVTSSPGGSFSNWWCSLFNADLALSVTMTAVSTVLSICMLPSNLFLYASAYDANVIKNIDFVALFISLGVVISAILMGLLASDKINSPIFHLWVNRFGNLAGLTLIIFSVFVSEGSRDGPGLWEKDWRFYVGTSAPCVIGLIIANVITTFVAKLPKPERVTASVECCYQNTGIATAVALTMYKKGGVELSEAIGVPLLYGIVEAVVLGLYCIVAWKIGWTKAPRNEKFWTVLVKSYEVDEEELEEAYRKDVHRLRESMMRTQSSQRRKLVLLGESMINVMMKLDGIEDEESNPKQDKSETELTVVEGHHDGSLGDQGLSTSEHTHTSSCLSNRV